MGHSYLCHSDLLVGIVEADHKTQFPTTAAYPVIQLKHEGKHNMHSVAFPCNKNQL